ncbi:LptF/LptG family permease [Capilliphycus salinus ALCB114379]|uniref:LptF/LptG family permease n=1 Tax=Capilliphycus salinus TaxID=2768948 RepID=UPI0039A732C3
MKTSISKSISSLKFPSFHLSILDRYIITELIAPFLFGVGLFTSVALSIDTVFDLVRQIAESGLDVGIAVQIFLLKMPEFIVLSFPMSMVLTTLIVYGRMSSDSEVVALRSCGISIYRLVIPTLIFSLFITASMFVFNELLVPASNYRASITLEKALHQDRLPVKEDNIFYPEYRRVPVENSDEEVSILVRLFYAQEFDGKNMKGVTILDQSQQGITQIISSESAVWNGTEQSWDFYDGTVYMVDPQGSYRNIVRFDHKELKLSRVPLDLASRKRRYDEMNIIQAHEYLELMKSSGNDKIVQKTKVRIQQKYSLPFVCVVFGLLGAALGCRPERTSRGTSFGLSIIIIFSYYLLAFVTGALGQKGILTPFVAGWLPIAIGLGVSSFLLYRTSR